MDGRIKEILSRGPGGEESRIKNQRAAGRRAAPTKSDTAQEYNTMTYLEYYILKLLGPGVWHGGTTGVTYWTCPFDEHSRPTFHTLPSVAGYKDRWMCMACDGDHAHDIYDLLRALADLEPGTPYP